MESADVVLGFLGNLICQTAESTLVQNGCHTCEDEGGRSQLQMESFTAAHPDVKTCHLPSMAYLKKRSFTFVTVAPSDS